MKKRFKGIDLAVGAVTMYGVYDRIMDWFCPSYRRGNLLSTIGFSIGAIAISNIVGTKAASFSASLREAIDMATRDSEKKPNPRMNFSEEA